MNIIRLEGVGGSYPEPIDGTAEWFACMIFPGGECDPCEAEEIVKISGNFSGSTCVLIHYPDGKIYRPFDLAENVFVGRPVYDGGVLYFLVIDLERRTIFIYSFSEHDGRASEVVSLPRECVPDLYNLMLKTSPVTLIRHGGDDDFDVVYPEKLSFRIGERETMYFRGGDKLYFTEWWEDDDYHERMIVRDSLSGKIIEKTDGMMRLMPNGDVWMT